MGSLPEAVLRVLFLDGACRLITDEQLQQGSLAQLILYPRIIFKRALELDAASIVLVHNHPSVDPTDRKSVVSGKSVSVRVDLGGRRIIKKKNTYKTDKRLAPYR